MWDILRGRMGSSLLFEEGIRDDSSSSLSSSSDEGVSREVSSEKIAYEDEDDESGEEKDGEISDKSREGMTSPSSFTDACAPTGSAAVNRAGGEEDSGRSRAERLGRRAFSAISPSAADSRVAAWVLGLAALIIFFRKSPVDFGTGNAGRTFGSITSGAVGEDSVSKKLGSRNDSKPAALAAMLLLGET